MTPSTFAETFIGYARQVQATYGLDPWAILTQWALESGWDTSTLAQAGHNLAGITHTDPHTGATVFSTYASVQAFTDDYIRTLGLSYYVGVRATAGQSVQATLAAFGASPWDATHYGNPPGTNLLNLWAGELEPLYASTGGVGDPTTLYSHLWGSIVALMRATGTPYLAAPWAGSQRLSGEHLGTVPSVADGANYCATMLQEVAIHEAAGQPVTGVTGAPAGTTDPAAALGPVYVGLVHAAEAMGTDVLGLPWASAQGLTAHHWGHPPSLDAGVSYLQGQADALTRYAGGNLYVVPTPATPPGAAPATSPPAPPAAGGSAPLPTPPPTTGQGLAGVESAWSALAGTLGTTLPAAVQRITTAGLPQAPASGAKERAV